MRPARRADLTAVATAVAELLRELGAEPPPAATLEDATRVLLEDERAVALLVAEDRGTIVGVLGASWQSAIHVPGRYVLIQDLWVHPAHRGQAIGRKLLRALFALALARGALRVEVGLPKETFGGIAATEAFYRAAGFESLGPRMRRVLE